MKIEKYLDSRDLIERLEELDRIETDWLEELIAMADAKILFDANPSEENKEEFNRLADSANLLELTPTEKEELRELREFCKECEQYSEDFRYGQSLIHESVWVEYCRELCQDIGDIPKNLPHYIESNIDWDGVADDIAADYTYVVYKNEVYYLRNS